MQSELGKVGSVWVMYEGADCREVGRVWGVWGVCGGCTEVQTTERWVECGDCEGVGEVHSELGKVGGVWGDVGEVQIE